MAWKAGRVPTLPPAVTDEAIDGLKFSVCLPRGLAAKVLQRRGEDERALGWVRREQATVAGGGRLSLSTAVE